MKNIKKGIFIIFILSLFLVKINLDVYASSGKLRESSICQGPNDVYYGQHSSDNHWHVAVKQSNGYYASGSSLSNNPCSSTALASATSEPKASTSSDKNISSSSNKTSTTSNYKKEVKGEVKNKKGNMPIIKGSDDKTITSKEDGKTISSKDIVKMFKIEVKDKEDGIIDFDNYLVSPSEIDLDEIGYHYITIYYKDTEGNVIEKELTLKVEEESFFDKIFG